MGSADPEPKADLGATIATFLSPGGRTIAITRKDGTAELWDPAAGQRIGFPLEHPDEDREAPPVGEYGPAVAPEDPPVAAHVSPPSLILEIAPGVAPEDPLEQPEHGIQQIQFRPDGRALLTLGVRKARLWDATTGRPLGPIFDHKLDKPFRCLSFGPDGKTVLLESFYRSRLWDATSGSPVGPWLNGGRRDAVVDLSPDGRTMITHDGDGVHLWEATTGRHLGPPLSMQHEITAAKFSPDGRNILTGCTDGTARLWDVAEWPAEWAPDVTLRIEAMTGMSLDDQGEVHYLDATEWRERLSRLASKGIPLSKRARWSLDSILYGPEPAPRAKAWVKRERWAEAEAAFEEAVKARPEDGRIRLERARFFAMRARPEQAATEYANALFVNVMHDLLPEDEKTRQVPGRRSQSLAAAERARAELSKEILRDRGIGDRVHTLVPKELFSLLDPLVRARFWEDQRRWADAEDAYNEAVYADIRGDHPYQGSSLMERGRYFAARSMRENAASDFFAAYTWMKNKGAALDELAKCILVNRGIRDLVLKDYRTMFPGSSGAAFELELLDAIFPRAPFAR